MTHSSPIGSFSAIRWRRAPWLTLSIAAAVFLLLHLPTLVAAPDDVDTTNFLLGIRRFSVAEHRPHPPGYPVYVGLGKASTAVVRAMAAGDDGTLSTRDETRALAVCSALVGALALFPLFVFFRALEGRAATAWWAALLTVCWPLYWFTASRALSDVVGLAVALLAQALLLDGLRRVRASPDDAPNRADAAVLGGSLVAGLAGGFRAQAAWLALPMLVAVMLLLARRRRLVLRAVAAFSVGFALWATPLVILSGGLQPYLAAVVQQASEDVSFVEILWTRRELPAVLRALDHSFIQPFGTPWLAVPVLLLVLAGVGTTLRRAPAAFLWLAVATGPYLLAHLLFHETFTTRYQLPLLPAMAYLAVRALDVGGNLWRVAGASSLAGLSLLVAIPAAVDHAREPAPPFRALAAMRADAESGGGASAVAMHYSNWLMLRGERFPVPVLETPLRFEWLELQQYWREGRPGQVWFLGDPKRLDLAMFDPNSVHLLRRFTWQHHWPGIGALMDGSRPGDVDWYRLTRPAWMLGEGWSINPQVRGVARRAGPDQGPVHAWVQRRTEGAVLMIGGRHLDPASGRSAKLSVTADGHAVATWTVPPTTDLFLRMIDLAPGPLEGDNGYAVLTVTEEADDGAPPPAMALEQFDLRSAGSVVYGFASGWNELEINSRTAEMWHWTTDRAEVQVRGSGQELTLRLSGDSPMVDHDTPPRVVIRAGDVILHRFEPRADFTEYVAVPARALQASGGLITIETDRWFVPAERSNSPDRRRLGLRIRALVIS